MTQAKPDLLDALEAVRVPAFVIDRDGRLRWMNHEAVEIVGDRVGEPFARFVAPEDLALARTNFARKLIGEATSTEFDLSVLGRDGQRHHFNISSVPLVEGGAVTGVFGLACPAKAAAERRRAAGSDAPELTARQYEALLLLADGLGTGEVAERLGVAEETARNHIRSLLRQLDVHSRLEAVVRAYKLGLLPPGPDEA
jgi:DNA-binding CsgD family transcriptional regulator